MSSPRGLFVCGIVWRVVEVPVARVDGFVVRVGDVERKEGGSVGRGKRKESGLNGNLERSGGLRTFKYMLRDRSALFA